MLFNDASFWLLANKARLDDVAAKESIHLLVAVDAPWRLCFFTARSDQYFVRNGVKNVRQLLFLHAHGLNFKEELCLWAYVRVIAALHKHDRDYVEERLNCCIELVHALPHYNLQHDEAPSEHLPKHQCQQEVRTHEMAGA